MLYSMTGYGRVVRETEHFTLTLELRSLNSRYSDLKLKLPSRYRAKEMDLRKILTSKLERGKIDFILEVEGTRSDDEHIIDAHVFGKYHAKFKELAEKHGIEEPGDLLYTISRLPNVIVSKPVELNQEEWALILKALDDTIQVFEQYRLDEGSVLDKDFRTRVQVILDLLEAVAEFEQTRIEKVRERLAQNLEEIGQVEKVDSNRFEQELIYYLEKYDITEEKVRLKQHCLYFLEQLDSTKKAKGKKLGFIIQEMGREINTLGSKANSSEIQRLVVQMKDELEKIKEQIANIL